MSPVQSAAVLLVAGTVALAGLLTPWSPARAAAPAPAQQQAMAAAFDKAVAAGFEGEVLAGDLQDIWFEQVAGRADRGRGLPHRTGAVWRWASSIRSRRISLHGTERDMKRRPQCSKPPVGLVTARKEALTLGEATKPYVRRRLERLRFNLDAAAPWVAAAITEAREKDKPWLLVVASELVSTRQTVSDFVRAQAFKRADWAHQAREILVAIDSMLLRYAEASADAHWEYLDKEPSEATAA